MTREEDILYENGDFWVTAAPRGKKGFLVWQSGLTHSRAVGTIGYAGEEGLRRAMNEADRRAGRSRYLNPWHKEGKPESGPPFYETEYLPTFYKGFQIFNRTPLVWDVVKNRVCVTQRAGLGGAMAAIDAIVALDPVTLAAVATYPTIRKVLETKETLCE